MSDAQSRGPGRFITHRVAPHPDGGHIVASSRRHRKGLAPHRVSALEAAERPRETRPRAFLHLFAPRRLAWWIGALFAIGASCFAAGGLFSAEPDLAPRVSGAHLGRLFALGAVFFTTAAWLQWLEALNRDIAKALDRDSAPSRWRWFGWRPHSLGYLASLIQLIGTLMFNANTLDALIPGLTWRQEDLLVWTPNMIGCACFLVASYLAFAEVSQRAWSFAPRSVSWWIAVINILGSVAFQISALYALANPAPPNPHHAFLANTYTAVGGVCFFLGAYLMIPELFDEAAE